MNRSSGIGLLLLDFFNICYNGFLLIFSFYLSFKLVDTLNLGTDHLSSAIKYLVLIIINFLILICTICLIYRLLPSQIQCHAKIPSHPRFLLWVLKFYIKKPLTLPLFHHLAHTFHTLSYLIYKSMGMKISYSFQMASNVDLRDPELFEIGNNVTIGSDTIIAGHFMVKDELVLKKVVLEDNVMIGAGVKILYGTTIGKNTIVGHATEISTEVKIGEKCVLGAKTIIGRGAIIGNNVRTKEYAHIPRGSIVPDNTVIDGTFSDLKK